MLDPFFDDISLNITELGKGIFSRSDHYSFYKKDIPVLFFFTGLHTDYHSATDEADRVNYLGMMEIAELVNEIVEYFTNKEDRLVFTKAPMEDQQMTTPTKLKGTLGIMPDYAGDIKGLKVDAVIENKAAQKAGIIDNDIVTAINNVSIESIYDYMRIMANLDNEQFCNGPVEGCVLPVGVTRGEESLTINVTF
jgi:C-terminal processing protease CtpA/Prc